MAHPLPRALLLAITLTAVFAIPHRAARAAGPAVVAVSPASAAATVGDDITIDITVANLAEQPGLGGYLVVLKWDPAVLSLTSLVDSGWLAAKGSNVVAFCETPGIDNAVGTASTYCSPGLAFGPGVSPSGALARAVFHAKAPGSTAIDLTGSNILNPSSGDIASTLTGCTVTVAAPALVEAATETPTPAPSSTPAPATSTIAAGTATAPPTSAPVPALIVTPASEATPEPIAQTPSTKPAQGTLSKVEVPRTGSGAPAGAEDSGIAWWIPALAAAGAASLGIGGFTALRWTRRRTK